MSAPTGFRHLKSAAEILKEFDPDFALRAQKRPNALPIAEAQASLRKPSSLSSPPTSPKSPPVVSPRDEAWRQQAPKFAPINNTVFCRVTVPFEGEKEGDLSCGVVGEVLACNSSQDFAEDYWFGAKTDGQIGYFPQRNCCWIKDDQTQ